MNRRDFTTLLGSGVLLHGLKAEAINALPDITSVPPDLTMPPMEIGAPAPGKRVRQTLAEYAGTEVHHALYLPTDWVPGKIYPIIVEYSGNGPFTSRYGDYSSGDVDGSKLGYGITGGHGFLWLTLPCVDMTHTKNQLWWWGDVEATLDYCRKAIAQACTQFGGDSTSIVLCGFSRGGIACNFLGLHDDIMADIWLAFIPCSHYDGVKRWPWDGSDSASAATRLSRLKGRACFIEQEASTGDIEKYLSSSKVDAPFTFYPLPFHNHTDIWVLRDLPQRRALRKWLADVLQHRPGTYALHGRVVGHHGKPMHNIQIRSGPIRSAMTDSKGRFVLQGLISGVHKIRAIAPNGELSMVEVIIEHSDPAPVLIQFS